MQRIAVAAHKGGSGKTTVAVNLAGALAGEGKSVLVVDCDPQGAAGAALGLTALKPTLYEVLSGGARVDEAIQETGTPGVSVLTADLDLAGAEIELPRRQSWQPALLDVLRTVTGYDLVVIDTAPGLGVLPYIALVAADRVLVVIPPEYLSLRALPAVLEAAQRARVPLIGIVPNRVERRTRHESDVLAALHASNGDQLLTEIPGRVILRDASVAGQPISTYAPGSEIAGAFQLLAQEVLA